MKTRMGVLKIAVAGLAMVAGILAPGVVAGEEVDMYDGQWRFGITPYLWLPSVHGNLEIPLPSGSISAEVEINPSSYLSNLQFGFMAAGQLRKGDFALVYDVIFSDLSGHNSKVRTLHGSNGDIQLPIDVHVNSKLDSSILSLGGSYTVARSDQGSIDVFAGVRYADLRTSVNWNLMGPIGIFPQSASVGRTVNLTDGIVGVLGHLRLSDDGKWYLPYEVDGGAGTNNKSWNGIIGVGYRFGWGSVELAFRNLYYGMNDHKLIQNTRLGGPALGATFRW